MDGRQFILWLAKKLQKPPHSTELEVVLVVGRISLKIDSLKQEADRLFVGLRWLDHGVVEASKRVARKLAQLGERRSVRQSRERNKAEISESCPISVQSQNVVSLCELLRWRLESLLAVSDKTHKRCNYPSVSSSVVFRRFSGWTPR